MAPMQMTVDEILERNKEYANSSHKKVPPLQTILGGDIQGNSPNIAVVTCLDSRCNPYEVLGFKPTEILCMRNVSGRVRPALSDIAALDSIFHLGQVVIMHHSNCGSTHGTIAQQRSDLKSSSPDLSAEELEEVIRGSAIRSDDDGGLKADLQLLRECRYIRKDLAKGALGFWLDVDTGLARQVKISSEASNI